MVRKLIGIAAAAATAAVMAASAQAAENTLQKIWERGKIVVGVKADYKPWGFRDTSGNIVGMEADMAKDVADALGVEVELVAVQSSNRMQFLQQGKIDLMIATMSDRADRRKIVGVPWPNYYTSGTNVMSAKAQGFKDWKELSGKPVCGKQGAFYNKIVSQRYDAKIVAFVNNAEAKQALKDGRCVAWVYDDSSIMADLASGDWNDYEMPLATEDDNPWGLAVPVEEVDGAYGRFMSGMIYNWHISGRLIELEKKWGIQPTAYLQKMHDKLMPNEAHLTQ